MLNNLKSQFGFSMIEASVSMAILAIAITLGMNFFSTQQKTKDTRGKQTIQRYIAIQITQHITSSLSLYPPIEPVAPSEKILYVGCMNKDGTLISTGGFQFYISNNFNENVTTGICPPEKTHYEVRFFWLNSSTNEVKINLLTQYPRSNVSLAVHNFKIFAK